MSRTKANRVYIVVGTISALGGTISGIGSQLIKTEKAKIIFKEDVNFYLNLIFKNFTYLVCMGVVRD